MARFDLLTQFPEWLKSFLDSPTPTLEPLGPKMLAVRDWLQSIMASSALDTRLKTDWPEAPVTYDEAALEAMEALNG